jgi:pimeloyl-ACP methyl ester carboxylesterase
VRNIAHFAADREVWCPDLPGMGDSDPPPAPGDVHAVAAATVEAVGMIHGLEKGFDLAGFSFGGIVGALAAVAGRLPVRHLVVVGSTALGLPLGEIRLQPWKAETDASRRRALHRANFEVLMLTKQGAEDPHALELYARDLERDRYRGRAIASTTLLLDALGEIPAPVGGIWGARDALIGAQPERARAALRSARSDARFAVVPDAGHWAAYEQPTRFNAALRAMLAD